MNDLEQLVKREDVDSITDEVNVHFSEQFDPVSPGTGRSNQLAKVGIGVIIGALVGAVAGALAGKVTVESVNNTVKGVGDAVKGAAEGVNHTVKGVGDAVKNVAENLNHTVKDVGDTVKSAAEDVNGNVKATVDVVKGTAEGVNQTVKATVDVVKVATEDVNRTVKATVDAAYEEQVKSGETDIKKQVETQTAYILVPVDKQRVDKVNAAPGGSLQENVD